MIDNKSAHISKEYDDKIITSIPFYDLFHQSTIDFILSVNKTANRWLDTGCGTGTLFMNASRVFANTHFTLADPSMRMIEVAKSKIHTNNKITFAVSDSQSLEYEDNTFDVITAIQCHHYLDKTARLKAIENCFRMLKPGGVFITFENIMPLSEGSVKIALKRWQEYQINQGKTPFAAEQHIVRIGTECFPISIIEHIDLLNEVGFSIADILWASYMQAGFYAIKEETGFIH